MSIENKYLNEAHLNKDDIKDDIVNIIEDIDSLKIKISDLKKYKLLDSNVINKSEVKQLDKMIFDLIQIESMMKKNLDFFRKI